MPDIELFNRIYYGASVKQWLLAATTFGVVYIVLALIQRLLVRRLGKIAARTPTDWDDLAVEIVRRTRPYFLLAIAVYAATRVLAPPSEVARVLRALGVVVVLLQAGVWGNGFIGFAADHYVRVRAAADSGGGTRATIHAVGYAGRFLLWGLLLVTALQNFGINVTALVTGLGIGGIAIALAVQNILGDLFAALAIVLDKPFVVGDSIQVDNITGTIEHVGLKTTRIRSQSGEQVIISNADLLKSRIRNYKRMEQRRAVFNLDVALDTPPEKLAGIPGMVRQVVEAQPLVRFDRSHLSAIEPTGMRVETVYIVLDPDYNKYADIQQSIYLELLGRFQRENIQLGFATRTLNLTPSQQ